MTENAVLDPCSMGEINNQVFLFNINCVPKIKASFSGFDISDRSLFAQSSCIIPTSVVGKKEQEADWFLATMALVSESFQSCTVLVVDSLYRHSLRVDYPNKTDAELYAMSIEAGDLWLARNQKIYQALPIPYKIVRWNKYLHHPNFQKQLQRVLHLYHTDAQYKNAINDTASEYLKRYHKHHPEKKLHDAQVLPFCIDYLKEGCAGMCLWIEDGYRFEVYPGRRTLATTATYEKLIKPSYPNLLKAIRIRFKKSSLAIYDNDITNNSRNT